MKHIFENFLYYCDEDNPKLTKDIKTWLADYFDLKHRLIPLYEDERNWIENNLSEELQLEILGIKLDTWNKMEKDRFKEENIK